MAVPGRRNGWIDDDDEDYNGGEAVGLFEEDGLVELEPDTPPHLRDLAAAAQLGDVENLRRALGISLFDHSFLIFMLFWTWNGLPSHCITDSRLKGLESFLCLWNW